MGSKIKLEFIKNKTKRNKTFKKKSGGLTKSLSEIKTVYGVDACAIIKNTTNGEQILWPNQSEVENVVKRFESFPEEIRGENMTNEIDYLAACVAKMESKLEKENKMIEELERELLLTTCLAGESLLEKDVPDYDEIKELCDNLDKGLALITKEIEMKKAEEGSSGSK